MFTSIDWLSFTWETDIDEGALAFEIWGRAAIKLNEQFPLAMLALIKGYEFVPRLGRAPYKSAQQRADNGVMCFAHPHLGHALMEVGGIGLDALGGIEQELALVHEVRGRITRLDIAVDIFTGVQPDEFAAHRTGKRFKTWSESISSSGHTVYVGSKSSDRYARVYRYFEPHPRASFLRIEHVLRAEQARSAADEIATIGIASFVAKIGNTFGWEHEIWAPDENTGEAIKAWQPERREGRTVMWVHSQVIPALLRLHQRGIVDVNQLYQEYIKPKLDPRGGIVYTEETNT